MPPMGHWPQIMATKMHQKCSISRNKIPNFSAEGAQTTGAYTDKNADHNCAPMLLSLLSQLLLI